MKYAPIVIFVYNRLSLTKKTINFLKKNKLIKKSEVYFFSDGPKNNLDNKKVEEVRKYIRNTNFSKKKKIIVSKKNKGLKKNITEGLNYIFQKYTKCIVLEDDICVSKDFLKLMNFYLNLYKLKYNVASIEGYMYPVKFSKNIESTFFLKGSGGWGWGTWRRSWKNYTNNRNLLMKKVNKMSKDQLYDFNYNNSYNYYKILKSNKNSWAINWYTINYLKNKYTLFFKHSLVKNVGFGSESTHTRLNYDLNKNFKIKTNKIFIPKKIFENKNVKDEISIFLRLQFNYFNKFKQILKNIL